MNLWERTQVVYRAWRYRLRTERTERTETLFLLEHLGPGQTALDIGSHKGVYAYWMHKRMVPGGRAIAFEPQPELAAYIDRMKEAFCPDRLTIVNAALSTTAGTRDLSLPTINPRGAATLEKASGGGRALQVSTMVLDEYLDAANARPVHFIKCDVEGHELDVFGGGERTLLEDRPKLFFECQDFRHSEGQTRRVFQFLGRLGYEGFFFDGGKPTPVSRFHRPPRRSSARPRLRGGFLPAERRPQIVERFRCRNTRRALTLPNSGQPCVKSFREPTFLPLTCFCESPILPTS
jgi:FkbM family methyltransferase